MSRAPRARAWLPWWLARRLAAALVTLAAISVVTFAATNVLPGDAASAALGDRATPERLAALRAQLGLDEPAPRRYLDWVGGLLHGDLGRSLQSQRPVGAVLAGRLPNTLALAVLAFAATCLIGLVVGLVAGAREGRRGDRLLSGATLAVVSLPEFVTATALVVVFAFGLGLLPPTSLLLPGASPWSDPSILVLPVLALTATSAAYLARVVRGATIDALGQRHVESARLRGVPERRVLLVHVLPAALLPAIQVLGGLCGFLIGGTVVVETVFSYPGLGQSLAGAVAARDTVLVQSLAMLIAAVVLAAYLAADLATMALVPQRRTAAR